MAIKLLSKNWVENLKLTIDTTLQDLQFALRQISLRPGFSLLVALTLAVGIGGSTAIFSVLKGVVLRDLPYPEPDRLVAVWEMQGGIRSYQPFTVPDIIDVRESEAGRSTTSGCSQGAGSISPETGPRQAMGSGMHGEPHARFSAHSPFTAGYFLEEEEIEGNNHVIILSYRLWQSQFGGEPEAVGRKIPVNGVQHEIIGIMPAEFEFPTPWGGRDDNQLWKPLVPRDENCSRSWHSFAGVARLAEGATLARPGTSSKPSRPSSPRIVSRTPTHLPACGSSH